MPSISSAGPSGVTLTPPAFLRNDGTYAVPGVGRPQEPAAAQGTTVPRYLASSSTAALSSGTVYACAIGLDYGVTVNNVSLFVAGTAESGGTHAWVGLADSGMNVLAVSADKTGATYFGGTNTAITTALAAPFVTTYAGLHYVLVVHVADHPARRGGGAYRADRHGRAPVLRLADLAAN